MIGIFTLALMAAMQPQSGSFPAPLTQAGGGKLQCVAPDAARKTCRSMAGYKTQGDGVIWHQATVMVSPEPLITMQTSTRVQIKKGEVCGVLTKEDIAKATFMVGDKPATAAQTAAYRPEIAVSYASMFGKEICTAYIAQGPNLIARASIDGRVQEGVDQKVVWVSPQDGYKVRP